MKITYSAPAKVILSGEHAVVYGKPALVSAIDLKLKFSLFPSMSSRTRFGISNKMLNQVQHDKETNKVVSMISQKVKDYFKKQKIKFENKNFNYKIESNIPVRQGLGSSAAFCVSATAAFLELFTDKEFDKVTINNIAYQSEKYFHKNASGVDTSVSTFGGLIFYRKEFEFLKNISALNFKIPKEIEKKLFIIDSGNALENTGQMVENVGRLYNKKPELVEQILNDIEKVTKRTVVSIVKEDSAFFEKCILNNQVFLEMLGVVSKKAKKLLGQLEAFGIGKVTGGGGKKEGSGFILFYAKKPLELENYCKKNKINFMKFKPSYEGVRKEI